MRSHMKYGACALWFRTVWFLDIKISTFLRVGYEWSERASKQLSPAERSSEASKAEQGNEWAVQEMSERTSMWLSAYVPNSGWSEPQWCGLWNVHARMHKCYELRQFYPSMLLKARSHHCLKFHHILLLWHSSQFVLNAGENMERGKLV